MIRVTKTYPAPSALSSSKAIREKNKIADMINAGTNPESNDFDSGVYGHADVKTHLKSDQHNKCAYCECDLCGDYAAVEHFRPKTAYEQVRGKLVYPAYHWLAYEWSNLVCSCDRCNATNNKGNMFPLQTPSSRDIQHQSILNEDPLFIDPTTEDPADYIEFHGCEIKPKMIDGGESLKGKTTIDEFHLNREVLFNSREKKWLEFQYIVQKFMSITGRSKEDAINTILPTYVRDEHIYAGMFRFQKRW